MWRRGVVHIRLQSSAKKISFDPWPFIVRTRPLMYSSMYMVLPKRLKFEIVQETSCNRNRAKDRRIVFDRWISAERLYHVRAPRRAGRNCYCFVGEVLFSGNEFTVPLMLIWAKSRPLLNVGIVPASGFLWWADLRFLASTQGARARTYVVCL